MKRSIIFSFALFFVAILNASSSNELSEVQKLKADNFILRNQLLQCTVKLENNSLTDERQSLINEFRKSLNAPEGAEFDWQTKTFKDVK